MTGKDWAAWHAAYENPASDLSFRLRSVQAAIGAWLDSRTDPALRVVSICAGEGRDLLGVLAGRPDAGRVSARLVELDPRNAAAARARAAAAGLPSVEVVEADAGLFAAYAGAVPADLVIVVGVLGNMSQADALATIAALPALCAAGATVLWTRGRQHHDRTPQLRAAFAGAGFAEQSFLAPEHSIFSFGVHRFDGRPRPLPGDGRMFTFTT
ncbi:SAM-dependent methyltransferase [Dactylosporangium vinaceum]|uniref:SAM-dependent methyltransferase n=1 Tax=Dactylosporangium vinaceum TaxID=53362 RepID=A0ABV5LZ43_9ACTN|nr:SAM-dependent methyltransferase [Dactylosporangium vinaceum]UAB95237.1 SAM-dependent methyltransferase [Dactylosporangium vinaceum]